MFDDAVRSTNSETTLQNYNTQTPLQNYNTKYFSSSRRGVDGVMSHSLYLYFYLRLRFDNK